MTAPGKNDQENRKPIILFDGCCNLCNNAVQFTIRHDPEQVFTFCALQSDKGIHLQKLYGFDLPRYGTFILIENGQAYIKSTAALRVSRRLNGMISLLYGFIIVPPFIRNGVYDFIARNRYRWFGKQDTCMIPSPSQQSRFLN